jgi:hypothetical protein
MALTARSAPIRKVRKGSIPGEEAAQSWCAARDVADRYGRAKRRAQTSFSAGPRKSKAEPRTSRNLD